MADSIIDCEAGRKLGCGTFCCRLLVRLHEDEREPDRDGVLAKGFIDKDADGFCVHLERDNHRCRNWGNRPRVCREYDCNHDYLLQVAVRVGVKNIVQLSRDSLHTHIAKECHIRIPGRGGESNNGETDHA